VRQRKFACEPDSAALCRRTSMAGFPLGHGRAQHEAFVCALTIWNLDHAVHPDANVLLQFRPDYTPVFAE